MRKKLLYIPLDYCRHAESDSIFNSMLSGFNTQFEARVFKNMEESTLFNPDLVYMHGNAISIEECHLLKKSTNAFFTIWVGDVRYAPLPEAMSMIDVANLYLFPFKGEQLKSFSRILNTPCEYLFEVFDDRQIRDVKEISSGRIVFVGNVYEHFPGGEERISLVKFIGKYTPELEYYGSFPYESNSAKGGIDFSNVPDLYNSSYLTIAHNNRNDIDGYFTHRNLIALASGSCVLMKYFPGIEEFFINWEHCVYYKTNYELLDVIEFLKRNPDIRNKIAKSGNTYVRENYLNANFAYKYNEILNKI